MEETQRFVLGLDLDGVCADFYGRMREIVGEWLGQPIDPNVEPNWGLTTWGLRDGEYDRLHRFAVTQRSLFESMKPMDGAPQAIRRLGTEGIRIRIITHRLFIRHFHEEAVKQTVRWLDNNGIPYWDLCFMRRKDDVGADLYVEDSSDNIKDLLRRKRYVLVFENSTNQDVLEMAPHVSSWSGAESAIRSHYYDWLDERGMERPPGVGLEPLWSRNEGSPARDEEPDADEDLPAS